MKTTQLRTRKFKRRRERRGAAAVEFAFCAPLFFLLIFTGIELARLNLVIRTTESACIQAARRGIIPGATPADVIAVAQDVLRTSGVTNPEIVVTPDRDLEDADSIQVDIIIPMSDNGSIANGFFSDSNIARSISFRRE